MWWHEVTFAACMGIGNEVYSDHLSPISVYEIAPQIVSEFSLNS